MGRGVPQGAQHQRTLRRIESGVPGGARAVLRCGVRQPTRLCDLRCDLRLRKQTAVGGLCALGELELNHFDLDTSAWGALRYASRNQIRCTRRVYRQTPKTPKNHFNNRQPRQPLCGVVYLFSCWGPGSSFRNENWFKNGAANCSFSRFTAEHTEGSPEDDVAVEKFAGGPLRTPNNPRPGPSPRLCALLFSSVACVSLARSQAASPSAPDDDSSAIHRRVSHAVASAPVVPPVDHFKARE